MKPETQKRILDAASQVFSEIGSASGSKSFGYEEGIRFLLKNGEKTLFELFLEHMGKIVPVIGHDQLLTPATAHQFLDAMSTRERAKVILYALPEPDPKKLEQILSEVSLFLPSVRRILGPFAKELPSPPGGAPRKISESEEPQVRSEVAKLFDDGYSLADAKAIVARHRGVSVSTVQRICRKGTIQSNGSEHD